jgi:hypothetical protein
LIFILRIAARLLLVRNPNVDLVTATVFLGHYRLDTTARYSQPNADDLEMAAGELQEAKHGNSPYAHQEPDETKSLS